VQIRALAPSDLDAVLAIQSSCPEAAQWSRADYERVCAAAESSTRAWVAISDAQLAGFILIRRAADEIEILNLAVAPGARRTGIASSLLHAALEPARNAGVRRAFLEVRESNAGAIAFYLHHGFTRTGRRPNYYSAPAEAALILSREI